MYRSTVYITLMQPALIVRRVEKLTQNETKQSIVRNMTSIIVLEPSYLTQQDRDRGCPYTLKGPLRIPNM